jgi:proton-dependent oligopeptide transporter, POT family
MKHPKGLYLLFAVEMWERFSYYGMRALLVLYMTKYLLFSTEQAGTVYGWYTGLAYLAPLIGGYLADRYLGQRKCIVIGSIFIAFGQFTLATPSLFSFYLGLLLIIIGTGFFKSNISTIVGLLYEQNDPRRDSGFTIFYMGINLGAFFSPLICGTLGEKYGWHYGFAAAGVGMVLGLIFYLLKQHEFLGDKGTQSVYSANQKKDFANTPLTIEEKQRVAVIFILTFFTIFFWASFEQAGSSLTLFADKSTNRLIPFLNIEIPASYFQAINPLFILLFAPFFSSMWISLAQKNLEPSIPIKFVNALVLVGVGFIFMIAASYLYEQSGPVSMFWLIGVYLVHTLGELCLSPVGLSMVTKLAPMKFASLLMGTWFLANFTANLVGGLFAGNFDAMDHKLFFLLPALTAFISAGILLALTPTLKRWMHGVK